MPLAVSLSGGKDSTWMLEQLLEDGEDVAVVMTFDTGWEFPEMLKHWDEIERRTGVEIVRLHAEPSLQWRFFNDPVRASKDYPREGICKGQVRYHGRGWASWTRRWCTRIKVQTLDAYAREHFPDSVRCIGFAADERHRAKESGSLWTSLRGKVRYPLIERGITEVEALRRCREVGYTWDGLYDHFDRVSCWCCPLQNYDSLRQLRVYYPELWERMLQMDASRPPHNKGFKGNLSVREVSARMGPSCRRKLRIKRR